MALKGIVWEELPRVPLALDEHYDYLRRGPVKSALTRAAQAAALAILRVYDFLAFGVRYEGLKNRPRLGRSGAVLICNHIHTLDCAMAAAVLWPKRHYFVTLQENLEMKGVRHLVRALGGVPIPEDRALRQAFPAVLRQALRLGAVVPVYPEGELRHYDAALRPFRNTAFSTAVRCSVPVVPLCITQRPARGLWFWKQHPCLTVHVLPALRPEPGAPRGPETVRLREAAFQEMDQCLRRYNQVKSTNENIKENPT